MLFLQPSTSAKSLGNQAYHSIRDAIITLKLQPGQGIMESELAELLQISRTPIREALQLLIAEQLVQVQPQRTKIISLISESKVKESAFVRLSLEQSAFQMVARSWNKDDQRFSKAEKELSALIERQSEAAEEQDVAQFLMLDEQFHRIILQLAGNETLLEVVYHMRGYLNRYRFLAMNDFLLPKHLAQEHKELLLALKANDTRKITQLLEEHLGKLDQELPLLKKKYPHYFQT